MSEGRLFVVSGPSGTGKGTVCRKLLGEIETALSISMTTREPRPGEIDGKDYFFTSHGEFERMIALGDFLEYAMVYGKYYGTPRQKVIEKLKGGADVILEIDTQGAFQVRQMYPDAILIFILPPSLSELKNRITRRGSETEEAIGIRMGETLKEIKSIGKYDYYVVNNELLETVAKIKAIITAEHLKVSRNIDKLLERYKEDV